MWRTLCRSTEVGSSCVCNCLNAEAGVTRDELTCEFEWLLVAWLFPMVGFHPKEEAFARIWSYSAHVPISSGQVRHP